MKRICLFAFWGFMFCAVPALGRDADGNLLPDAECENLLMKAEKDRDNQEVYDLCDFSDEIRAWNTWAPFASAHDMKRALFELCRRYPTHEYGMMYCEKAIRLNYGPALKYWGDISFKTNEWGKAISYYTEALKTTDLTSEEQTRIAENLGIIYVTPDTPHYNPAAGAALLSKASGNRSAVANNALGYLYFTGKADLEPDPKEALTCFWRAVLLGCPAAEENLGAFHLVRQQKITQDEAVDYMSPQAFTCESAQIFRDLSHKKQQVLDCPCKEVLEKEAFYQSQPYLYVDLSDNQAVLQDKAGNRQTVKQGQKLSDGTIVSEIRNRAVILLKSGNRIIINRYVSDNCLKLCRAERDNPEAALPTRIQPYHLTFTEQECADIAYYAQHLVDTNLPYTGKEECGLTPPEEPVLDEATKILLDIREKQAPAAPSREDALKKARQAVGI